MAEATTTETESTKNTEQATETNASEKTPTVEELMRQLANERAEKERYKIASDKASSEAAAYK